MSRIDDQMAWPALLSPAEARDPFTRERHARALRSEVAWSLLRRAMRRMLRLLRPRVTAPPRAPLRPV